MLYDAPGPRARRRALIGTIVAASPPRPAVRRAERLDDRGQFSMELWGPLINPGDENFEPVWRLLGKGLLATLTAAGWRSCSRW